MSFRRVLVLAVGCAAVPLALCACGSSGDSAPSDETPDAAQSDAPGKEGQADDAQVDGEQADGDPVDVSESEDSSLDALELSQADYPAAMAATICDNLGACCAGHGYQHDAVTCRELLQAGYQDLMDEVAQSDAVTYDAKAAADCVEQQKAYVLKCVAEQADLDALMAVCGKVLAGSRQNGQLCAYGFECAGAGTSSSECNDESDSDGGAYRQCEPASGALARGAAGATCNASCRVMTGSHTTCERVGEYVPAEAACWVEDGLRCDAATHKCTSVQPMGQPCGMDTDCEASTYCEAGVCTALVEDGQACDPDAPIQCTKQSHCGTSSMVCAPNKKEGEECAEPLECESWQCHGGTCQPENLIAPYYCIES